MTKRMTMYFTVDCGDDEVETVNEIISKLFSNEDKIWDWDLVDTEVSGEEIED